MGFDPYNQEVPAQELADLTTKAVDEERTDLTSVVNSDQSIKQRAQASSRRPAFKTDERLLSEISNYLDANSHYKLKIRNLMVHLRQVLPSSSVPKKCTLYDIIKEQFHLRFGAKQQAQPKYGDPLYNEKRLWISRLLAQFFIEQVVIVSIDESNFKSSNLSRRSWAFNSDLAFKRIDRQTRHLKHQALKR